jgi:hypothetical protein
VEIGAIIGQPDKVSERAHTKNAMIRKCNKMVYGDKHTTRQ